MRNITAVKPLDNYKLECIFDEGTIKIADISSYINKEAFKPIADPHVFASALLNRGYFVEWNGFDIDLSADTLWHIGTAPQ